ncbi:MAG TPA: LPS assembly protein LptD, partial [Anaerolineales bacterium]
MRHIFSIATILILFSVFVLSRDAGAEEMVKNGGVTIWADLLTHDQDIGDFRAKGNVMVLWNGIILIADMVTLSDSRNEAVAEGGVRLVKGGDVLYCDRLAVNLITENGEVINGRLFSRKSNFHVEGERIEKIGPDEYRLEHGTFTVCDGENPSWKFSADDIDVTLEGFAVGKNALFHIKDVPVLYTPYMLFPVKRERQSGFLFPHLGNSNKKGFNFNIPFYWAISPSQEAVIGLDVQSKRGAGLSLDYNYLRPREGLGNAHGYYIYDFKRDKGRGNLTFQEQEWISTSFVLKSDVNLVADRDFFRDFAEASGEYNRQILDSSISLTKNWESFSLAGEFRYVDDLDAASNRNTLQKLPNIGFAAIRKKINGFPLYAGLDSSFVNFYHDDGIRGQRADFHPFMALYLPVTDGVDFSAWGGYRERLYNAYAGESGNGTHDMGLVDAGFTIAGSLTRIYESDLGALRRVRHTLVPEF